MTRSRRLFLFLACPACLLGAVACGGGGTPEPSVIPEAGATGHGLHLAQLNDPASKTPGNATYTATGLQVAWIDRFDESANGKGAGDVYLRDFTATELPYQGILAYSPTYSPPALELVLNDVVDATGPYSLYQTATDQAGFPGIPELGAPILSFRFDDPGNEVDPIVLQKADLMDQDTCVKWMSMLVTIQGPFVMGSAKLPAQDAQGNYLPGFASAPILQDTPTAGNLLPVINNNLSDIVPTLASLKLPTTVQSVTGFVTHFGTCNISPRYPSDIAL